MSHHGHRLAVLEVRDVAPMNIIYCSSCGYGNPPGSVYCQQCRKMLNP